MCWEDRERERKEGRGGVKGTEAPKKTMTEEEELRSDSIVVRLRRSVFAVVGGSRFCFSYRWEERGDDAEVVEKREMGSGGEAAPP